MPSLLTLPAEIESIITTHVGSIQCDQCPQWPAVCSLPPDCPVPGSQQPVSQLQGLESNRYPSTLWNGGAEGSLPMESIVFS